MRSLPQELRLWYYKSRQWLRHVVLCRSHCPVSYTHLPHFGQDRNGPLTCGSLGRGHGEVAAADLVVMVHQIVLDGDKPTLKVDVAPAQANRFRDTASGTQHEGEHREPVLELRRFLDEIQKRLLLGQGQSVSFGRFVLVGGFNGRQDTIRGIHTDVLIVHRHRKDLMENILDGFQRVQRHLAIADDAIVVAADIRLANVLELHHADLIPNEPIIHINVIGEGMLFQAQDVYKRQYRNKAPTYAFRALKSPIFQGFARIVGGVCECFYRNNRSRMLQ